MHDTGAFLNPPHHYYKLMALLFLSLFLVFVISTLLGGFWPSFCMYFCAELLIAQSEFICQWTQTSGSLLAQRWKDRAGSQGRYWRTGIAFSWSISAYYNSDIACCHSGIQWRISIHLTHCTKCFLWVLALFPYRFYVSQKCASMSVCVGKREWKWVRVCVNEITWYYQSAGRTMTLL